MHCLHLVFLLWVKKMAINDLTCNPPRVLLITSERILLDAPRVTRNKCLGHRSGVGMFQIRTWQVQQGSVLFAFGSPR
jgi:hypothetical protein